MKGSRRPGPWISWLALGWAGALLFVANAVSEGVHRAVYLDVPVGTLSALTNRPAFPAYPMLETVEPSLEMPPDAGVQYGTRWRAWLIPPQSGWYRFAIASEDQSALYLSAGESPEERRRIARVESLTDFREWDAEPGQRSEPVRLEAGHRYYLEVLQVRYGLGGHVSVRWQLPDGTIEEPIPGVRLEPFGCLGPAIIVQPEAQTVMEGEPATFHMEVGRPYQVKYQWFCDGEPLGGAQAPTMTWPRAALADNGREFYCLASNLMAASRSQSVRLQVRPDRTRPAVILVSRAIDWDILQVEFSEPVAAASAMALVHYILKPEGTIFSAWLSPDGRTVLLDTTPLLPDTEYTLVVGGLTDTAATPNRLAPAQTVRVRQEFEPLPVDWLAGSTERPGPCSRRTPLVITEIMMHPPARADRRNLEYVELYNSQAWAEDIGGFRLSGSIDYTFPSGTVLGAQAYAVVAAAAADLAAVYRLNAIGQYAGSLPDDAGRIRLLNRQGAVLLEIEYADEPGWPAATHGAGHSLVLARPSMGERDPRAWSAGDTLGGTPGKAESWNWVPARGVRINEFQAGDEGGRAGFVELYNAGPEPVDLSGCVLSDDPQLVRLKIAPGKVIAPGGFLHWSEETLGFRPAYPRTTIYLRDAGAVRLLDAVRCDGVVPGVAMGRYPDGSALPVRLPSPSAGHANPRPERSEVVIDEVMFHPLSGEPGEEYLELHNRSLAAIPLEGWRLRRGVNYTFPPGCRIEPGGYLVVGSQPERLQQLYPWLKSHQVTGPWTGRLDQHGESVQLVRPETYARSSVALPDSLAVTEVVLDEVTIGPGGRWSRYADGGGSSLEMVDLRANPAFPSNWADSDETTKGDWVTVEHKGVMDYGLVVADALDILLQGAGECLVDQVEVIGPDGLNRLVNGDFEAGLESWICRGTHEASGLELRQGINATACLHLRSSGRGDTGANQVHGRLRTALAPGETVTLRARVRWLVGCPEILLRLRGNWLEASGHVARGLVLGTPGKPNSRARANAPPAIGGVRHDPPVPRAGESVTIAAAIDDPDGLSSVMLYYRVDPARVWHGIPMRAGGAGRYWARLSGQAEGVLVAFYIAASDRYLQPATAVFPPGAPEKECLVRFGDPAVAGPFGTYRIWITQATLDRWRQREKQSHHPLAATFVSDEGRIDYLVGVHFAGSAVKARYFDSPIGNWCDYNLYFPADEPWLGEADIRITWPGNHGDDTSQQKEQAAYWAIGQLGLPTCHRRHVAMYVNGVRRGELMEDVQQPGRDLIEQWYPDASEGDLHEVQWWFEFGPNLILYGLNGAALQDIRTVGGQKKLAFYRWTWPRRGGGSQAADYTNLFALVDTATAPVASPNFLSRLREVVDIDQWLRTLAIQHAIGNFDSFGYLFWTGHNMYVYKPAAGTWKFLVWDVDSAFADHPSANLFEFGDPTLQRMLQVPALRRIYLRGLAEAAAGPLDPQRFGPGLQARLAAFRQAGLNPKPPDAITGFLLPRRAVIQAAVARAEAPLEMTSPAVDYVEAMGHTLQIAGTAPLRVTELAINGRRYSLTWPSLTNWVTTLDLAPGTNRFIIIGLAADGSEVAAAPAPITIVRADSLPDPGEVVINEIMLDPERAGGGYIELLNRSRESTLNLSGWELNGTVFTDDTLLEPGRCLVVVENPAGFHLRYGNVAWVAGVLRQRLNPVSGLLSLVRPGEWPGERILVDEVSYHTVPPWPAGGANQGLALQLLDADQDNNRPGNWGVMTDAPEGGATPGMPNAICTRLPSFPTLRLNEIQAVNGVGLVDHNGEPDPWLELHNHGTEPVPLHTLSLSDQPADPARWRFPSNAIIPAGGWAVVWLDAEPGEATGQEWHANFHPSVSGGGVALYDWASGGPVAVDALQYPAGQAGVSFGLPLDGRVAERRWLFRPTPGAANQTVEPPVRIVINEWMADNKRTRPDPADGQFEDWFELYNAGGEFVDLGGFQLTDNLNDFTRWMIPSGTRLAPGAFVLVWADGEPSQNQPGRDLHANFKLSASGDAIGLFTPDGQLVDTVRFGRQAPDISQGFWPDGSPRRVGMETPTPGGANRYYGAEHPPRILGQRRGSQGALEVTFEGLPGHTYRIEAATNLAAPLWQTVVLPRAVSAAQETWLVPAVKSACQYLRLVLMD